MDGPDAAVSARVDCAACLVDQAERAGVAVGFAAAWWMMGFVCAEGGGVGKPLCEAHTWSLTQVRASLLRARGIGHEARSGGLS
jgi:hypothetical protein